MTTTDKTFQEINESYTISEAIAEAKRCLNCKNPLCKKGCPIEHDIPGFIHQLSMGNMGAAMSIINESVCAPMKNSARATACSMPKVKASRSASWSASSPTLILR